MGEEDVRAAGAQRLPHAAAGRDGGAGRVGHAHAQGRHQRGDPRLGDQRARRRTTSSARWWAPTRIPRMVRDFQSVIGREARAQMLARTGAAAAHRGRVRRRRLQRDGDLRRLRRRSGRGAGRRGGGGRGHRRPVATAPRSRRARPGVLHGSLSYLLQDADGQVRPAHSVSAGLDYPGVGPEHSWLHDTRPGALRDGRPTRRRSTRSSRCAGSRGSSRRSRPRTRSPGCCGSAGAGPPDAPVLLCLSGRGDKDVAHVAGDPRRRTRDGRPARRPGPAGLAGRGAAAEPGARRCAPSRCTCPTTRSTSAPARTCAPPSRPIWAGARRAGARRSPRPTSSGRSRWSTTSSPGPRAWPGSCTRTGCASLTLLPGVEEEEIVRFLEVVNRARYLQPDAGDDLLTLLWEQEFEFIRYRFVEGFGDDGSMPEAMPARWAADSAGRRAAQVQQQVREEAPPEAGGDRGPRGLRLRRSTSSTSARSSTCASSCAQEYAATSAPTRSTSCSTSSSCSRSPAIRDEIIGDPRDAASRTCSTPGSSGTVAPVLREVRAAGAAGAAPVRRARATGSTGLRGELSEPEIVRQLLQSRSTRRAALAGDEDVDRGAARAPAGGARGRSSTWLPDAAATRSARAARGGGRPPRASSPPAEVLRLLRDPSSRGGPARSSSMCGRLKLQAAVPGLGETVRSPIRRCGWPRCRRWPRSARPARSPRSNARSTTTTARVRLAAVRAWARAAIAERAQADRGRDPGQASAGRRPHREDGVLRGVRRDRRARRPSRRCSGMLLSRAACSGCKEAPETRACAAMALGTDPHARGAGRAAEGGGRQGPRGAQRGQPRAAGAGPVSQSAEPRRDRPSQDGAAAPGAGAALPARRSTPRCGASSCTRSRTRRCRRRSTTSQATARELLAHRARSRAPPRRRLHLRELDAAPARARQLRLVQPDPGAVPRPSRSARSGCTRASSGATGRSSSASCSACGRVAASRRACSTTLAERASAAPGRRHLEIEPAPAEPRRASRTRSGEGGGQAHLRAGRGGHQGGDQQRADGPGHQRQEDQARGADHRRPGAQQRDLAGRASPPSATTTSTRSPTR